MQHATLILVIILSAAYSTPCRPSPFPPFQIQHPTVSQEAMRCVCVFVCYVSVRIVQRRKLNYK